MYWKPMEKNNNNCQECRGPLKPVDSWWHDEIYSLEEDDQLYLCNIKYVKYKCQNCGFETIKEEWVEKIRKADINEVIDE